MTMTRSYNLDSTVEEMAEVLKAEILADVKKGIVPNDIESFSDLHYFVDANMYGAFGDDEWDANHDDDGEPTDKWSNWMDVITKTQDVVDAWIKEGGLK